MIHVSQKQQLEGQNTKNMQGQNHILGIEQYPHPLRKRLGEGPPKVEEVKSRRNPAKGMAGTPATVEERQRRRQERAGRVRVGTARRQPSPPPLYTRPSLRLDYPALGADNLAPPDIPPRGADIPAWEPETDQLEIFKNRCCFDEKFELVCKD
jgi:hypothetical protein